jgi:hypothetical protein
VNECCSWGILSLPATPKSFLCQDTLVLIQKQSGTSDEHQHHDKIVVLLLGMTLSLSLSLMGPTGQEEDGCGERAVHQGVTSETTEFQCVVLCAWFPTYKNASSSSC